MPELCTIIGVGPGLGMALARRFGLEGMKVALVARDQTKLDRYQRELRDLGIAAVTQSADASNSEALDRALSTVRSAHGENQVLIYNAAKFAPGVLSSLSAEEVRSNLSVNVEGALTAARNVLPTMRSQDRGVIIFTGGGAADTPLPEMGTLSLDKAALRIAALTLAEEVKGSGVQVGTITIYGAIEPDTPFDPNSIADVYWQFYMGERDGPEIAFRGEA